MDKVFLTQFMPGKVLEKIESGALRMLPELGQIVATKTN